MPTRYERGRNAEHYVKQKLLARGASTIIRSSRSLTPFDLVAFDLDHHTIMLVQVKTSKRGVDLGKVSEEYADIKKYDGIWRVRTGFYVRSKKGWISTL